MTTTTQAPTAADSQGEPRNRLCAALQYALSETKSSGGSQRRLKENKKERGQKAARGSKGAFTLFVANWRSVWKSVLKNIRLIGVLFHNNKDFLPFAKHLIDNVSNLFLKKAFE